MIPKKIFQSWKTKRLGKEMEKNVNAVKELNPDYEHYLYDDQDCRSLLLENFGENYAIAFDALKPGAFKCDLWRYAVLYLYGGIYIDMDMTPLIPFDDIIENYNFVSVVDRKIMGIDCALYQAFIACVPKHPVMKYCLDISFFNVATRKYEVVESLSITGPLVAGVAMNLYWNKKYTYEPIKAGIYGDVKLLKNNGDFVIDKDKKHVIKNKFDGYDRGILSYVINRPYHKDPKMGTRKNIFLVIFGVIGLLFLLLIINIILRKRFSTCKVSLNRCVST